MGNFSGHRTQDDNASDGTISDNQARERAARRSSSKAHTVALTRLFEKLELTADDGNSHPGELRKTTFENAFHGPLHKFGRLMYLKMVNGHGSRDRITKEQFIKAGKVILQKFDEAEYQPYYFSLFTAGKDYLTKEDTIQMVNICYALTLSVAKFPYSKNEKDDKFFEAMVTSMFGIEEKVNYDQFVSWLKRHCPHMFCGVHNWVYSILTGSTLPSELETAPVPQLEGYVEGRYSLTLGMLWVLTATLPASFTRAPKTENITPHNPMVTTYQLLMKLARLSQCQSWTLMYNSEDHGLSMNRFSHHVVSYFGPSLMVISFEGRNLYCVSCDSGWREGPTRFGGEDCMLIQMMPVYRVIQAGPQLLSWNSSSRERPKGIQLGQDGKTVVLFLPADFDHVTHYGVSCALHKVEVWGCGTKDDKEAQVKQKQWEARDTDRQKNRKLRIDDDWRENPDKQILEWGGVKLSHTYNR